MRIIVRNACNNNYLSKLEVTFLFSCLKIMKYLHNMNSEIRKNDDLIIHGKVIKYMNANICQKFKNEK